MTNKPELDHSAIAAVTLRKPDAKYLLDKLSFGRAELRRNGTAPIAAGTLTIHLNPDAVARAVAEGGNNATSIMVTPSKIANVERNGEVHEGLRGAIVERGLFGCRVPLRVEKRAAGAVRDLALDALEVAAASLNGLAKRSPQVIVCCDGCARIRDEARLKRRAEREAKLIAERDAALAKASTTTKYRLQRDYDSKLRFLKHYGVLPENAELTRFVQYGYYYNQALRDPDDVPSNCVHAPMLYEALEGFVTTYPEVAFEIAGFIVPVAQRFVMTTEHQSAVIARWMLDRAVTRRKLYEFSYDSRRAVSDRGHTHMRARQRAHAFTHLPEVQRIGFAWATEIWGYGANMPGIGPDTGDVVSDDETVRLRADDDETRLDLSRIAPESVLAPMPRASLPSPTPKVEAREVAALEAKPKPQKIERVAPAPSQPVETKKPVRAKAPKAKPARAKVAPNAITMTIETFDLLGIPRKTVREMVREGRLIEVAPGQFVAKT